MFPPPPLFLHEPGRFQGTQGDPSRLDGCRQTLDVERVRPQTTRRQSVTETRAHGFDSRRLHHCHCMRSVSAVRASSKVACGSAPSAEQARPPEEVQERQQRTDCSRHVGQCGGVQHPVHPLPLLRRDNPVLHEQAVMQRVVMRGKPRVFGHTPEMSGVIVAA